MISEPLRPISMEPICIESYMSFSAPSWPEWKFCTTMRPLVRSASRDFSFSAKWKASPPMPSVWLKRMVIGAASAGREIIAPPRPTAPTAPIVASTWRRFGRSWESAFFICVVSIE